VTPQLLARGKVLVGLGANCPGPWGTAQDTIAQALGEIERINIAVTAVSPFYETAAVGSRGRLVSGVCLATDAGQYTTLAERMKSPPVLCGSRTDDCCSPPLAMRAAYESTLARITPAKHKAQQYDQEAKALKVTVAELVK